MFNHPFLLGFDELDDMLDRLTKGADGFPPYNLEQTDAGTLRISLAVAGYVESDLSITVEDNRLTIRGRQSQEPERHYLHHGIAARAFVKTFVLADGMTILGADLENGLLHIDLQKPIRKTQVQTIAIQTKSQPVLLDAGDAGKKKK